jgi:accessory gene regulator B
MITQFSKKLASFFVSKKIIECDDKEVYEYSFEIFLATILNGLFIAITAIVTKTILVTLFYLVGFLTLRGVAGGYHAKNHFRCFFILVFTYGLFLITQSYISSNYVHRRHRYLLQSLVGYMLLS